METRTASKYGFVRLRRLFSPGYERLLSAQRATGVQRRRIAGIDSEITVILVRNSVHRVYILNQLHRCPPFVDASRSTKMKNYSLKSLASLGAMTAWQYPFSG
jgi:hypothetical protein